jgi:hypothetical protein
MIQANDRLLVNAETRLQFQAFLVEFMVDREALEHIFL